jgi:hypothetical protein
MTISGDPPKAACEIYRVSEKCALCGVVPPPSERQRRRYTFTWRKDEVASASESGFILSAFRVATRPIRNDGYLVAAPSN